MRAIALVALLTAAPALAVGLGPLSKEGLTDGDKKGFYLTVINPYPKAERFVLSPLHLDAEATAPRVKIVPSDVVIGAGQSRKVLVVASGLTPGEDYAFRICAEKPLLNTETIHARVCSKLRARRIARS